MEEEEADFDDEEESDEEEEGGEDDSTSILVSTNADDGFERVVNDSNEVAEVTANDFSAGSGISSRKIRFTVSTAASLVNDARSAPTNL